MLKEMKMPPSPVDLSLIGGPYDLLPAGIDAPRTNARLDGDTLPEAGSALRIGAAARAAHIDSVEARLPKPQENGEAVVEAPEIGNTALPSAEVEQALREELLANDSPGG
jgi:hypothetical protein